MRLRTRYAGAVTLSIVAILAVVAGGSSNASASSAPLTIANFEPYTGADAFLGGQYSAVCDIVAKVVNDAGGVLGHTFNCAPFDSTSDPADALPVANRMIASTPNLAFVFGPGEGAVTPAALPPIDAAKAVHDVGDADPRYDHQTSPYFFRMAPSDSQAGVALALDAIRRGYKHAAAVFTNDQSAQTEVVPLRAIYPKLGGKLAIDVTLTPGATSYRTEISQVLAAKPDAIVMEMSDPQTAATFLSELVQLDTSVLPPIITTGADTSPQWITTAVKAAGKNNIERSMTWLQPNVPTGPGYGVYKKTLLALTQPIQDRQQYLGDQYAEWPYDFGVICALAMLEAKSTQSSKWVSFVRKIANGSSGSVFINQHGNNAGPFAAFKFTGNAAALAVIPGTQITPAQLATALSKSK